MCSAHVKLGRIPASFRRRILGISALAVKSAHYEVTNSCRFELVTGINHLFGQPRQFVPTQLAFGVELIRETNDTQLLFRIESLNLLNDLTSGH
jgi:hypothetical protein